MPSYTKQVKPSVSYTKQTRSFSSKAGRFGMGRFGSARFGMSDAFTKQARPSVSFTKQARPT